MKKLLTVVLCAAALLSAQQAPMRAPGFCLADTNAQWRDLADYRGKVVVLEFMQTTCPHCADFTKILSGVAKKYGDRVQVLSVALPNDTMPGLIQFVKGHNLPWPHLYDMGQMAFSYIRQPNVSFPTVFLIDGNGMIAGRWEYGGLTKGVFEGDQLSREVDKLIGAPAPAVPKKK
jgi:peroxiredoxin